MGVKIIDNVNHRIKQPLKDDKIIDKINEQFNTNPNGVLRL